MEWKVRVHHRVYRFSERLHRLRFEWGGFLRLRVGDVGIIFKVGFETETI